MLSLGGADAQSTSETTPVVRLSSVPTISQDQAGGFVVRATRVKHPIKADGNLSEEAYQEIEPITAFIQQEPHEGAPITERTEAWVMFDDEYIYLSCRCWDEHPERIVANEMRRDSGNQ